MGDCHNECKNKEWELMESYKGGGWIKTELKMPLTCRRDAIDILFKYELASLDKKYKLRLKRG